MTPEADRSQLLDALAEEFLGRCRSGAAPSIADYAARHPELADEIRQLFPALLMLEDFGTDLASQVPAPPEQLGDYRILRPLGRGGMGAVFLAEQSSLRRQVALKLLHPQLATSASALRRFQVEAASAARLHHSGIVQIHAVGEAAGHHFISMEYVEGCSLQDVLDGLRGSDPGLRDGRACARKLAPGGSEPGYEAAAARLIAAVADALQHAHDAGITHRDVKPSNILLRQDGTAVLSDFGLARDADLPSLTSPGVFAGTPNYASPEQATAGKERPDARSDVFSLGVTLYELLTLQLPFAGRSSPEVLHAIVHQDPPDPRRHNRRVPRDLATIVLTALQKAPSQRYQSAGALAADLRRFLADQPIVARPASLTTRTVKLVRRHRAVAAAAAVALLGSSAGAAWWLSRPGEVWIPELQSGVAVYVDGTRVEARSGQPLTLTPEPHIVYLLAEDGRSMSRRTEVDVSRGRRTTQPLQLVDLPRILASLRRGDSDRQDWPGSAALDAEIAQTMEQDLQQARGLLAQGRVEDVENLLQQMQRLDPAAPATAAVQPLLEQAKGQQATVSAIEQRAAALLQDGSLPNLRQAWDALGELPMTLDQRPFQPAAECKQRCGEKIVRQALNGAADATAIDAMCQYEAFVQEVSRQLANVSPGDLRLLGVRIVEARQKLERRGDDARTAARRADLDALDAAHRDLQELAPSAARTRQALEWIAAIRHAKAELERSSGETTPTAFAAEDTGQLSRLQASVGKCARDIETVSPAMAEKLGLLGRELDAATAFLQRLRELGVLSATTPGEALQHLEGLCAGLRPGLADIAVTRLLPPRRARFGLLVQCAAVEAACRQRDLPLALRQLSKLGPDAAREPRVLPVLLLVQNLVAEEQQRLRLVSAFARYRTLVADLDFEAADALLPQLQHGWREALQQGRTAVEQHGTTRLLPLQAELHLLLGEPQAALDAIALIQTPRARFLAGIACWQLAGEAQENDGPQRLRQAVQHFEAADAGSRDARVMYWLGLCHRKLRDYEAAKAALLDAERRGFAGADLHTQQAELVYLDAVRANETVAGDDQQRMLQRLMPQVVGDCNAACRSPVSIDELLANPGGVARARALRARIYLRRALARASAAEFQDARDDSTAALSIESDSVPALLSRGYALLELGDLVGAQADAKRVLELCPGPCADRDEGERLLGEIKQRR